MRAISLHQPWASAVMAGIKTIETRGWATEFRGRMAIHAAKRDTGTEMDAWVLNVHSEIWVLEWLAAFERIGIRNYSDLPRGMILGSVELLDCLPTVKLLARGLVSKKEMVWGNFESGRFGWVLGKVHVFPKPWPCTGRQRFFQWPSPVKPAARPQPENDNAQAPENYPRG